MGNITTGTPGGYYYYSLTCGSLSAPVEARCQGFSVSDGTAGWQTSSAWCSGGDQGSRSGRYMCWDGSAVTSKPVLRSAGVPGYVTVILS